MLLLPLIFSSSHFALFYITISSTRRVFNFDHYPFFILLTKNAYYVKFNWDLEQVHHEYICVLDFSRDSQKLKSKTKGTYSKQKVKGLTVNSVVTQPTVHTKHSYLRNVSEFEKKAYLIFHRKSWNRFIKQKFFIN